MKPIRSLLLRASGIAYDAQVLADSPLQYLKLNQPSGTAMADSSGNSRTGTLSGSTYTLNQAGLFAGGGGKSIQFTNSADNSIDSTDFYGAAYAGPLTVECMVQVPNLSAQNHILGSGQATGDWRLFLRIETDGSVFFAVVTTSGGNALVGAQSAAGLIAANTPYLLTGVWDPGAGGTNGIRIYVNGVQVQFTNNNSVNLRNPIDTSVILAHAITTGSGFRFNGNLQAVSWYGTALSAARIADHYASRDIA
jgi:hypothetical protein